MMDHQANPIQNRVDDSGLTTLDLDNLISRKQIASFDLVDCLENGLIPVSYTHLTLPTKRIV